MTSLKSILALGTLLFSASCTSEPAANASQSAAVFSISANVSDGRKLTGEAVYRSGQSDVFCMRNATLACSGEIPFSTRPGAEISFPFTCDNGTEGFGTMYRKTVGRVIVPTHGKAVFDTGTSAQISIALDRRTKGESFAEVEACERL
ncbi:hypothetical protein shim_01150 [Shimia sp. SK013]|uniref:hypothetical protein n=1 Tax=Shimia sp. SK013 TaxID=1389006 RepID=UPI0006B44980|nr:hypothetical protein [Shimia sp. SK013]KPA23507.1 hypothetical protein shim_01150 [Shimia sp. SK013]